MRVALGVSGGVAAYKAAELVRKLQKEGIDVQVVMTKSAQEFITPLTFAALTGQKVITEMFGSESAGANVESAIGGERDHHGLAQLGELGRRRARQVERHALHHQRRRDHEDDEQHEHHVDHRRDVDLAQGGAPVATTA